MTISPELRPTPEGFEGPEEQRLPLHVIEGGSDTAPVERATAYVEEGPEDEENTFFELLLDEALADAETGESEPDQLPSELVELEPETEPTLAAWEVNILNMTMGIWNEADQQSLKAKLSGLSGPEVEPAELHIRNWMGRWADRMPAGQKVKAGGKQSGVTAELTKPEWLAMSNFSGHRQMKGRQPMSAEEVFTDSQLVDRIQSLGLLPEAVFTAGFEKLLNTAIEVGFYDQPTDTEK